MPQYLPIRAFNRSQQVRIGKQKVLPNATTFVDIDDPVSRKELGHHSTLGAVFVVGPLSASNADVVVQSGASTDEGAANNDMVVRTYAGTIRNRQTGATVSVPQTDTTIAAADGTNPRNDVIQVNTTTGAVTKVTGTPAAAPTTPAVTAGNIGIAVVNVPANDTAITTSQVTDTRVFA